MSLTQSDWVHLLTYDPIKGTFFWNDVPEVYINVRKKKIGTSSIKGHKKIVYRGQDYRAHHVAWIIMTGSYPKEQLDHINGDRGDNRFSNLREVTHHQNMMNRIHAKNNTSGYKGVIKRKYGYEACIQYQGKKKYIGLFNNPIDAAIAYDKAAIKYFGQYARTNKSLGLIP